MSVDVAGMKEKERKKKQGFKMRDKKLCFVTPQKMFFRNNNKMSGHDKSISRNKITRSRIFGKTGKENCFALSDILRAGQV